MCQKVCDNGANMDAPIEHDRELYDILLDGSTQEILLGKMLTLNDSGMKDYLHQLQTIGVITGDDYDKYTNMTVAQCACSLVEYVCKCLGVCTSKDCCV